MGDSIPFDQIVINAAAIQELTIKDIIDDKRNTSPGWNYAPQQDRELRDLRNKIAHGKGTASLTKAEESLRYMLEQLLS